MKFIMKTITIILILAFLFITACKGNQQSVVKGSFIGGTQGITTIFEPFGVEEDRIYTIFDEETFALEVTAHNRGEYNIQPGEVTIKLMGPSLSEFSGIASWELQNKQAIDKVSELVPDGGEETFTFADNAKYLGKVTGIMDREWFANIEYNYKTFLIIPEVCLKEDQTDERVCTVNEAKTFFVSGAPITVRAVEESTAGKGVMALKIKVSNAGTGKVTKPGEEFGVRNTLSYSIDDAAWECKSGGKVNEARLENGEAEIVCKLKEALPPGTLATKQLQFTFAYKYRDIIQEKLRIKESAK